MDELAGTGDIDRAPIIPLQHTRHRGKAQPMWPSPYRWTMVSRERVSMRKAADAIFKRRDHQRALPPDASLGIRGFWRLGTESKRIGVHAVHTVISI
jgi:hypothetical protein